MTAVDIWNQAHDGLVGAHVHPVDAPDVDLVVDAVAEQHWDTSWLSTHDSAGQKVYLAAEDAVLDGGAS